jgi:hypothetical protein
MMHPASNPLTRAAFDYINKRDWTLCAVGHNKKPLGQWGPGGTNRYDAHNMEHVFQMGDAPGIGVITGPSRLVIIDLDNEEAIRAWASRFGQPDTLIARTPRGRHLYYASPPGLHIPPGTNIMEGVDVRGGESYAILPPSQLAGGEYAWANDAPIMPLPREVRELVERAKPERRTLIQSGEPFPEGLRNDHLFSMAGSMRQAGFDYSSILAALVEVNKTRCVPPVAYAELENLADSAMRYEAGNPTGLPILSSLRAQAATLDADDDPLLYQGLQAYDINAMLTSEPPPVAWVWDGYLAGGKLSVIHGEGGLGKSYFTLKVAESIVNPNILELIGKHVTTGSVVIIDGENSQDETHRRLHHTRIRPSDPLHYYSATDPILGLEEHTRSLLDHIQQQHQPKLVIIDSLRALWVGDEREQAEAGRMLRDFSHHISQHADTAYLLIHHDNKGGEYSGSTDINAAITGTRMHLTRMQDKEERYEQPRVLTQLKSRISREQPAYAFQLVIRPVEPADRGQRSGIEFARILTGGRQAIQDKANQAYDKYAGQTIPASQVRDYLGFDPKADEWAEVRQQMNAMGYTIDPPARNGTYAGRNEITFTHKSFGPQT